MLGCKHRKGVVKCIHLLRQGQTLNQLQDFSFCIRHELILSTLASRYVFAHNEVYHKIQCFPAEKCNRPTFFKEIYGFIWKKRK